MKTSLKILSIIMTVVLLSFSLFGCIFDDYNYLGYEIGEIDEENLELVGEPTMRVEFNEEYNEYEIYIEGLVKNLSEDSHRSSIYLTFVIYDADGNTLTTTYGYCDYLEAGGTWRFSSYGSSPFEPASFKLVSLY